MSTQNSRSQIRPTNHITMPSNQEAGPSKRAAEPTNQVAVPTYQVDEVSQDEHSGSESSESE
jgi:hypothetical protein